MGLKTMSLLVGTETVISVTGGEPLVFADDGITIANGLHLVVPADTDYQRRKQATLKYRAPSLDPKTGFYTKDKKSVSFTIPLVLPNGSVVFNTIRVEREIHPSLDSVDVAILNQVGAQLLFDADTVNFWATGSLS